MKIKHLVLAGFAAALLASPPACAQGVPVLLERGVPVLLERGVPVLLERALVEFGFIARGARLATPMVTRSASDLYSIRHDLRNLQPEQSLGIFELQDFSLNVSAEPQF